MSGPHAVDCCPYISLRALSLSLRRPPHFGMRFRLSAFEMTREVLHNFPLAMSFVFHSCVVLPNETYLRLLSPFPPLFLLFICVPLFRHLVPRFRMLWNHLIVTGIQHSTAHTHIENVRFVLFIYLFIRFVVVVVAAFVGGRINFLSAMLNFGPHTTVKQFYNRQQHLLRLPSAGTIRTFWRPI